MNIFALKVQAKASLPLSEIKKYKCLFKDNATQLLNAQGHYYFLTQHRPPIISTNIQDTICHDTLVYGNEDHYLYPRLNEKRAFELWDSNCIKCRDQNSDGQLDVNSEITKRYNDAVGSNSSYIDIFFKLVWPDAPAIKGALKGISTKQELGLIMIPFFDSNNNSFCPTKKDFQSNNLLLNIIGDYSGGDTQAIYMADSNFYDSDSGKTKFDILLSVKNDLKRVWFYFENGRFHTPDEETIKTKTIHFFHPFDFKSPYIQKSYQTMYTIRHPHNIGQSGVQTGNTQPLSSDRRFGCVPVSEKI